MARSLKENERRLPLHPQHLDRIPDDLRQSIYLERGYGDRFGMSDDQLKGWVAGFRTRGQLVEQCDVILQPKPLLSDIAELRAGQVLWGWPHCVQDEELTQVAIELKLTLIAFEAMNHWNSTGLWRPRLLKRRSTTFSHPCLTDRAVSSSTFPTPSLSCCPVPVTPPEERDSRQTRATPSPVRRHVPHAARAGSRRR
jgi:hypothetical protein